MEGVACDFWGVTQNTEFTPHIQSYFVVFKPNVFLAEPFHDYFAAVKMQDEVSKVVLSYEVPMAEYF